MYTHTNTLKYQGLFKHIRYFSAVIILDVYFS